MKNKKALSNVLTFFILIALVLVAVGVVWYAVDNLLNETHFKITEEQCWEEITIVKETDCSELPKEENDNYVSCSYYGYDEVCEQVEVDLEYIENLPIDENVIIHLAFITYFDIGNKENWFSDWLDENCYSLLTPTQYRTNLSEDQKRVMRKLTKDNNKKFIYQCGDYFVEVSK